MQPLLPGHQRRVSPATRRISLGQKRSQPLRQNLSNFLLKRRPHPCENAAPSALPLRRPAQTNQVSNPAQNPAPDPLLAANTTKPAHRRSAQSPMRHQHPLPEGYGLQPVHWPSRSVMGFSPRGTVFGRRFHTSHHLHRHPSHLRPSSLIATQHQRNQRRPRRHYLQPKLRGQIISQPVAPIFGIESPPVATTTDSARISPATIPRENRRPNRVQL